ncbi:unnamed protein product [Angiostrongylus costaricensis]|uniref:Autophagy-related protein 2 n=1 Tax=Angiostrongylus costaricensis TaxID=334426 RepID=A0A158PKP0_ANGCS|nr:unnamed protein product [Angiostrongylus costaricensis]
MKVSDFNITDGLHNRWCRFIIQRYLGQFLEQNLTLDQLSVKLFAGELSINEVKINAHYVNELLTSMNVPLRLTDGFVGGITIEVPWRSITSDASKMKVKQLDLTFLSREGVKLDNKDLVSSMIGSVVESLVSSSELARSFYENEKCSSEEEFDTEAKDGVKAFTKVIDAIVSRFCLELEETTIRFENPPKFMVRFIDEQMRNCQQEGGSTETITNQPQGMGSIANLNKFMDISGLEVFTDVFTEFDDQCSDNNSSQILTSMYIRREKQKHKLVTNPEATSELSSSTLSSSTANYQSCYSNFNAGETVSQQFRDEFKVTRVDSQRVLSSNPIKFAEFVGESRVIFRIKNSDALVDKRDNRIEIESFFTGLHCFILPSQVDILKRFFSSVVLPQPEKSADFGKKMEKSDYDAMAKNIEEEAFQKAQVTAQGMHGTWKKRENFHEFDSINLEDNRTSRRFSEACRDNYKTLKSETNRRESTILSAKIGTVIICIPHVDMMSVEFVRNLSSDCSESIDYVLAESNAFFTKAAKVSLKHTNLHTTRTLLDHLYNKDHLRLVGTSILFHYQMEKSDAGEQMNMKLVFPNMDFIEYLIPESNPHDPESAHLPLLDFSNIECMDQEPQMKLVFSSSPSGSDESKVFVYMGKCRCDLDLSIVDRVPDLLEPQPFFDLPSYRRSRLDNVMRKDHLQLREDLFSVPLINDQSNKTMVVVKCQALDLNIRIPIADLRSPSGPRSVYRQRHVHTEYIGLHVSSVTVEVPLGGENMLLELFATEIYGYFCGVSEKFTCSEEDRRFLWGGQTSVDEPIHMKLEYDPRNKILKASDTKIHSISSITDEMTKSISLSVIQSLPQREGPFAQTHRSFLHKHEEGNDLILAGSREEMTSFGAKCILQSAFVISFDVPILRLLMPSHSYLEVLYNRLVNDLLLWHPATPSTRPREEEFKINALSDDMFQECSGDPMEHYEDDDEEERFQSSTHTNRYDRNKSHILSFSLNVKKGTLMMCQTISKNEKDKSTCQISVELSDAQLFMVSGYHGSLTDTYFYFTARTVGVGHRNNCMMPKVVNQADFGKWNRDDTQMNSIPVGDEFRSQSADDAIGVAIYLCERPGQNIKDVLLAIAVRNSIVQLRPFRNSKETWMFQLADFLTLQDYPIPGYDLPMVTTDLHVHLDNVVLAYDHAWTNPESDVRLRLVLGESDISSSIMQDMNVAKVVSIFEGARIFISSAKKSKENVRFEERLSSKEYVKSAPLKRRFLKVVHVGLFQFEFLSSLFLDEHSALNCPLLDIRCRSDIIEAWVCADSLVVLMNLASEISQCGNYTPSDRKEYCFGNQSSNKITSKRSKHDEPTTFASSEALPTNSPNPVEIKMKRMLASAMQETPLSFSGPTNSVPYGKVALEEFSPTYSTNKIGKDLQMNTLVDNVHTERNRAYSLSTDDEFCMVDEDVIGSGVTNPTGEPNIKYIGSQRGRSPLNTGITVDPHHFRVPSDWCGDVLAALPADFSTPTVRYLFRDISISLHLYGGSDLGEDPPKERSYSTSEYREGKGKNQFVSTDVAGGKYRDHSVCVVLELSKITFVYQLFGKNSPLMSMKLFTIHNITLLDKLVASQIKEMMYQYSSGDQPRRTCAPMLAIRMVESHKNEGKLRVSLLPIKFNIDQDTMEFLDDFFQEVRSSVELHIEVPDNVSSQPVLEIPATIKSEKEVSRVVVDNLYPCLDDDDVNINLNVLTPKAAPSSICNLLDSKIRASHLISPVEEVSAPSSSPDFIHAGPLLDELVSMVDDLHLAGDWNSGSEIKFPDVDHCGPMTTVEKKLVGASSHESLHQEKTVDDEHADPSSGSNGVLIDTSTATDENSRGACKDHVCHDGICAEMPPLSVKREESSEMVETTRSSTFFKEFIFSPAVSVYVDYHGKNKINVERNGAIFGVLSGIGQLNRTKFVLKEIVNRNGLLGIGRCINVAIDEWLSDIKSSIPNVLASCSPISPLVQIGKGVVDLFWLPVAELRKENGHVVKGIQKGVGSFGLSSAAGVVGMAQTVVGVIQVVILRIVQMLAETVLHEVQPSAPYLNERNRRAVAARTVAPIDLRHGLQLAYDIASDGYRQARDDLELAAQEDRASGQSSFRNVLKVAPTTIIRPLVAGTQIGYQLLGGLKAQLRPDVYQDERHKWKNEEVPGGSGQR